jgi:uncharacterized membrane protein
MRNDISLPAPGPLGNTTVTGFVGCHAQAMIGTTIDRATNNFLNTVVSPLNSV